MRETGDTAAPEYEAWLRARERVWWKQLFDRQAPYRWNLRRLHPGRTLDVGCGRGRNLAFLDDAVGVDHNESCVAACRAAGFTAYASREWADAAEAGQGGFDTMLVSHVVEHMSPTAAEELLAAYLPYLRAGARIVLITPQEAGFRKDPTHVTYVDLEGQRRLLEACGAEVERAFSFPFPAPVGRVFPYNEHVSVGRIGDAG